MVRIITSLVPDCDCCGVSVCGCPSLPAQLLAATSLGGVDLFFSGADAFWRGFAQYDGCGDFDALAVFVTCAEGGTFAIDMRLCSDFAGFNPDLSNFIEKIENHCQTWVQQIQIPDFDCDDPLNMEFDEMLPGPFYSCFDGEVDCGLDLPQIATISE